jgi:Zn-dependent protease
MDATNAVFYIAILLMSVVIHEVSHGFVAEYFGDKTARMAGRLTLNPLKHLDFFGSILLPIMMYFSFGFAFGWAKPVPYNPNNLSNRKWGTIWVAAAGVLANFFIATIFGLLIRFTSGLSLPDGFYFITTSIVIVNLALAIFNLVPIPPLDGSKILFQILPRSLYAVEEVLSHYGLIFLLIFVFFLSSYLYPILAFLFHLLTGLAF